MNEQGCRAIYHGKEKAAAEAAAAGRMRIAYLLELERLLLPRLFELLRPAELVLRSPPCMLWFQLLLLRSPFLGMMKVLSFQSLDWEWS